MRAVGRLYLGEKAITSRLVEAFKNPEAFQKLEL